MLNDDNIDRELSAEVETATNKHLSGRICPLCQKPLTCEVVCWVRKIHHAYFEADTIYTVISVRAIHRGCIHVSYYVKHTVTIPSCTLLPYEKIVQWTAEYLVESLTEESEKK